MRKCRLGAGAVIRCAVFWDLTRIVIKFLKLFTHRKRKSALRYLG